MSANAELTYSVRVEHYERRGDGSWRYTDVTDPGAIIALPSVDCELKFDEVYEKVIFSNSDLG